MTALLMTRKPAPVRGSHHSSREESGETRERQLSHVPVMVKEVLEALELKSGDVVVDATFGQGGHSAAMKKAAKIKLIALDADPAALRLSSGQAVLNANFADLAKVLDKL